MTSYVAPSILFLEFYNTLNEKDLNILETILERTPSENTHTGCIHSLLKDVDKPYGLPHKRGNPRIGLPRLTSGKWFKKKKPISWIVCAVNGKLPPDDGVARECSHACLHDDCINIDCLTWETRRCNQSRAATDSEGYRICLRLCNHCDESLCKCQNIHKPYCK